MPLYEFRCKSCGEEYEELVASERSPVPDCPKCGGKTIERKISVFGSAMGFCGNSGFK